MLLLWTLPSSLFPPLLPENFSDHSFILLDGCLLFICWHCFFLLLHNISLGKSMCAKPLDLCILPAFSVCSLWPHGQFRLHALSPSAAPDQSSSICPKQRSRLSKLHPQSLFPYFNKCHCSFYAKWFLASIFLSVLFPLLRLYFCHTCLPRDTYPSSNLRIASVMKHYQPGLENVMTDSCLLTLKEVSRIVCVVLNCEEACCREREEHRGRKP